jgi:hypothetical protein
MHLKDWRVQVYRGGGSPPRLIRGDSASDIVENVHVSAIVETAHGGERCEKIER